VTALSLPQLLALLAVSWTLLLFLYLRRPERVRRVVPYLRLWDELVAADGATHRQRTAAARSWSLLRALAITTLIALALFDPRPAAFGATFGTTLIAIDAGAHMRATDVSPSRFARAQDLARNLLAARARAGSVSVALLGSAITPLSGWSRDERTLRDAISRGRVSDEATRLSALVDYALTTLRERARPELILVSDGAVALAARDLDRLREAGIELRQLSVGHSARNFAIRSFAVRPLASDADRAEAMIELENTDRQPHPVELTLLEGGTPIDVQRLTLGARQRTQQFLRIGASGREYRARVAAVNGSADAQPLDDVAYAVLTQPPPRRALLVSEGQRYLETALALDARLTIERITPNRYAHARGYDLVIFDRFAPTTPPEVPSLWLAGGPWRVLGTVERPFFDTLERDDPLLRFVSLRDVNVRRSQRVELAKADRVVAGARATPLLVAGTRAGQPFVALTFDVRESDLVLRTAFPILLANAVSQLTAAESRLETPLLLGRAQPRAVPPEVETASLRGPDGGLQTLVARKGEVWIRPGRAGFYELSAAGVSQLLAANPDPNAVSEIAPRRIAPPPASEAKTVRALPFGLTPWALLLGAAMLLLIFEFGLAARGWRA
jgi:hypothetical protein